MRSSFISLVLSSARSPANNLAPLLTFNLPLFPAVSLIFYFLLTALFAHLCRLSTASPFPLSPCHVLPFNRLRKWAEVTASLQYNRAVNCSDYILWELYLLLSLNEDWPDTYLSLYAWKCRMPERFRYIFWIQSPLLSFPYHLFLAPPPPQFPPLKTNLNANKANLPDLSSHRKDILKRKRQIIAVPQEKCSQTWMENL